MTALPLTARTAAPRSPAAQAPPIRTAKIPSYLPETGGLDLVVEMAHDLRSPLSAVLMLAEQLQSGRSGPVTSRQRRELGLIYSAAFCLCQTASDMVELARSDNRLDEIQPAAFSLSDVLTELRDTAAPMAEERGLEIRLESPTADRRIGHARPLSRVLLNLTTNALKYTDQGEVAITARATAPDRVEFAVADTGRGIDAAALRTLYQPFHTHPAGQRGHFNSAGLGLAICHRLVAAMGGELDLVTQPRTGTRFFFELSMPLAP
ncbi:MAG: sensor histidine kinase [Gemmatimonadales bacterium]